MKKIGGVALAVAAVLLSTVPVEALQRGNVQGRSGAPQIRSQHSASQSFTRHAGSKQHRGFRQHRGGRPHQGFRQDRGGRQHHGFRQHRGPGQRHGLREHRGFRHQPRFRHHGPRHQPRFEHRPGVRRHHHGRFFVSPPRVFVPPVIVHRPAPLYVYPPAHYWYYCQDPAGYYPYVQECPPGWIPVVPH